MQIELASAGPTRTAGPARARAGWLGWCAIYGVILLAWAAVWAMAATSGPAETVGVVDWLRALCGTGAGQSSFPPVFAMWAIMSAAMMLPTTVTALRDFHMLSDTAAAQGVGPSPTTGLILHVGGYLSVWIGFSVLAAALQLWLSSFGLIDGFGRSTSLFLTALLFGGAAAWQFSALKDACLDKCRHPMNVFLASWRPSAAYALRSGAEMGLACLACCWALMLLGLVGGVMSLLWMGAATLFMTLEKLPDIGRRLTRPMGVLLALAANFCLGALAAETFLI